MNCISKIALILLIAAPAYTMEHPNPILACVAQSSTWEQACEHATELLKAQSGDHKIVTAQFLLASQRKFHHSMYAIGFSMATPESLEIVKELREEAETLWLIRPSNKFFSVYLCAQEHLKDKIPSMLYYIFERSAHAKEARHPYSKECFINALANPHPEQLPYWIDSGLLHNSTQLAHFFSTQLTFCENEKSITSVRQVIDAGLGLDVKITIPKDTDPHICNTYSILDYAMERKVYFESYGDKYNQRIWIAMQIIRLLIKAGAKSNSEL